ncbi:hypothetical protein HYY71_04930 [Candidatus Woesearchaeota archaeon]|nr:hypothetical protein [Candidatus Woesearchaeota archaeon]
MIEVVINNLNGFEGVEITEIPIEDGLVAKLKEVLSKAKEYGSVGIRYLVGTDIVDFIKAHEGIRDKIKPRTRIEKAIHYFYYAKNFAGRAMPTLLELDGIRHIVEGRYKIGFGELALGAYKNFSDYYAIRGRNAFNEMVVLAKKQLENKNQ